MAQTDSINNPSKFLTIIKEEKRKQGKPEQSGKVQA